MLSIQALRYHALLALLGSVLLPLWATAENADANQPWETQQSADESTVSARHEAAAVVVGTDLFVFGGRGLRAVERYDTVAKTWHQLGTPAVEFHHFQPVLWQDMVYMTSGFYCCYPDEELFTNIKLYDPATDTWSEGDEIPAARRRGGAASVVYQNLIYNLGGNTQGHNGGAVAWFDSYDPATGAWQTLSDAPHARDHFAAVVIDDKLIAAAGRATTQPNPYLNTITAVDIYDFATGQWSTTAAPLPTPRAGTVVAAYGTELIVIGGETGDSLGALDTVEAFDVVTGQWRSLQSLVLGRHGGGGAVIGDQLHVVAGGMNRGGGTETDTHELLLLDPPVTPPVDTDVDGLTDEQELNQYQTDPANPDSDNDLLGDGREIDLGTDPNNPDSDADLLSDGDEVLHHVTNPLLADTDEDTLTDGAEIQQHGTNPKSPDTDADGLDDAAEIALGLDPVHPDTDGDLLGDGREINLTNTNPLEADTDGDGANDGVELNAGSDPTVADSDSDGLSDGDEILKHGTSPVRADSDDDGLSDAEEIEANLDPLDADTDGDGISDFDELNAPAPGPEPEPDPGTEPEPAPAPEPISSGGTNGWLFSLVLIGFCVHRCRRA